MGVDDPLDTWTALALTNLECTHGDTQRCPRILGIALGADTPFDAWQDAHICHAEPATECLSASASCFGPS